MRWAILIQIVSHRGEGINHNYFQIDKSASLLRIIINQFLWDSAIFIIMTFILCFESPPLTIMKHNTHYLEENKIYTS